MKKAVLLACVIVVSGFASCNSEKYEYEKALRCYKSYKSELKGNAYCRYGIRTIDDAIEALEKAKIDLEICLVDKSIYR